MLDFWVKFKKVDIYVEYEVGNLIIVDEMFLLTVEEGDVEEVESDGKCDLEKVESVGEGDVGGVQADGEGVSATVIEDNDSEVVADEYVGDFVTLDRVDNVADEYVCDFTTSHGMDNVAVASNGEKEYGNETEIWDSDEHGSLVGFDEDEKHEDGPFKSEFLTTVRRDANNQMFPVAWAVVKVECIDSWVWFLSLLSTDLDLKDGVEHKNCAKHVFTNWSRRKLRKSYECDFWQIVKYRTERE
ncbi:hypothetical protein PVK06_034515 [Gossypium arboreum]|uniref:Uncharacterized protein n=1 Tax=Gossypium arboreum TaxID=29729 RepID=A0ABR0NEG3_GOSAR|nr:hypothetical protein PVK06_034515 [Gossypium arboreum]